jgi:hypothetical protein
MNKKALTMKKWMFVQFLHRTRRDILDEDYFWLAIMK